ncbi:MAG: FAD-dependent oxidoreductase [Pseudomonadota bacterium]|nr:FAD-dependent oxidoreductase [Pseudomonadota bacterium]
MTGGLFDVAVVGAGIHGAGVAQAAAAAGHSVVLIEQYAGPARGTSSRSSKLIHGGLRYLEQAQFALVRECLEERALLLRLAPELVRLTPFHLPVYAAGDSVWRLRAGLTLYALLARCGPGARFSSVPRSRWHDLDGLETRNLRHLFRYFDAQTDDAALTRAVIASAEALGAEVHYQTALVAAQVDTRRAVLQCESPAGSRELAAGVLINAAGPWVAEVIAKVSPPQRPVPLSLVAGSHVLLPGRLTHGAYTLRARDARVFFALPAGSHVLVGTTELEFRGDPAGVAPTPMERAYLVDNFRSAFPGHPAAASEPLDSFAGLRVLPAQTGPANRRSRETILRSADGNNGRLLSIIGGKLTAYRATADKVLRRVGHLLPNRRRRADTRDLPLRPVD